MDVSGVVDDEAESEGKLIILIGEGVLDLVDVGRGARDLLTLKESGEIGKSIDDVDG